MNTDGIKTIIKTLRETNKEQTKGDLVNEDGCFCALGVIYNEVLGYTPEDMLNHFSEFPMDESDYPSIDDLTGDEDITNTIFEKNGGGCTFSEIADALQELVDANQADGLI